MFRGDTKITTHFSPGAGAQAVLRGYNKTLCSLRLRGSNMPTIPKCEPDCRQCLRDASARVTLPVVAVLLLLAFGVRVWALGAADLTFDEVATFYVAHRPLLDVIRYVMGAVREHPPVYYLLMSLWMRVAGDGEFALRFPSVLIGVLAVSWSYRLGRRLPGKYGGRWSALLCAIVPFGVWAGRTGRMYAFVLLLSLVVMESWLRWVERPGRRRWLGFVALSAVAALTHYYLALLWAAQALVLLLLPRETRAIRRPWLLTLAGVGLFVGFFVAISPGIRAMLLEVARRFPYKGFRGSELGIVFTDLYIWGFRPELLWAGLVGLGLTLLGWVTCARRQRLLGVLLAAWGIVPLVIAHAVPERLETRYLTPIFPALLLGVAALLARLRFFPARWLATGSLLWLAVWRLPLFYADPDTTFSTRVATLHVAAEPGDALLMNGPWPALLLEYYRPPAFLDIYAVPVAAPPGFSAAVDVPRLEQIFARHSRVWVSYGAIHWADPQYSVSRWLAENAYRVFERAGMVLYLAPAGDAVEAGADVVLGPRLYLRRATVDRQAAQIGDTIRVRLDFEGDGLGQGLGLALGVLDAQGNVWQQVEARLGPVHRPYDATLPGRWREQRGLLLLPGTPPGRYTLAFRVEGAEVRLPEAGSIDGWIPLAALDILPGASGPNLEALLPNPVGVAATFDGALALAGVQPSTANAMQGYLTGFYVWWRAAGATTARDARVRLTGPETWDAGTFPLGPEAYPPDVWQAGDVVRQSVFFTLPDDLSAGRYQVQIQVPSDTGVPLAVYATAAKNGWCDLFSFAVEARTRHYAPPPVRTRRDVRFGEVLRLRGYRLERKDVRPGESVRLTVYWQALEAPARVYAVFNHLRGPDGTIFWQGDSWPQAGIYTTDHWRKREVVAEEYTIVIPADLSPGEYALYTGVYDPATGVRLPATTAQGERLVNDEFVLLHLDVVP